MKKYLTGLILSSLLFAVCSGQSEPDSLMRKCMQTTGPASKYLKDFRVQLGEGKPGSEFRFKANMSLWKNTRYRFSMCTPAESKRELLLDIRDDLNKSVASSVDHKTGNIYSFIDFICNKSGIYHLYYDFPECHSGLGVSIVSLIR